VLAEMLDPNQVVGMNLEEDEADRPTKQAAILINGLRAAQRLFQANSQADVAPLAAAADKLAKNPPDNPLGSRIADVARETLRIVRP
jgi:hypothetical protein